MTCSGIEVVITSTIGNRVAVKSGPRVRIPPTAPKGKPPKPCGFGGFCCKEVSHFVCLVRPKGFHPRISGSCQP